jgi:hypothetical protein
MDPKKLGYFGPSQVIETNSHAASSHRFRTGLDFST